ncbi:hypothetical protein FISHEDRAFT_71721 [Fistulina hepatica ATCC 64428]|uniref:Uncharacterized protein n=1 Tax=Fistulina hepatica ATCC 64428 TaxID=1128425 RepID=A0A0D7AIK5_9AGAR|nr:hypothetical protein FISHEDRAFT_71721 [Fistulina hepatica ATCC 64428]
MSPASPALTNVLQASRRTLSKVGRPRPVHVAPQSPASQARAFSSTVSENDPEVLVKEKERNLSGKQHTTSSTLDHAPGWNEYLATDSEAAVKADGSTDTFVQMTARTVEHIKMRHPVENGTLEASYASDTVMGPLSKKGVETRAELTASEEAVKADRGEI